jgi:predicted acylesterase/phospholipase RssA
MRVTDASLTQDEKGSVKRALILAGGGVRLAYQAGVLKALEEQGLRFDHIDGTSGGIFNTAMLACGLSPDEIAERWRKLKLAHFMSVNFPRESFKINIRMGLGDADGIREKIFPALGIDVEKLRNNRDVVATFNVCNFSDKSIESIPHSEVTEDHLIAGVSLPIFMPAIKINNDWYSDAVWIKDANLVEAVKRGAEELWLVWAIGNDTEYQPGAFNQYVHMIEMSANGGLLEEYAQIKCINERIMKGDSPYGQKNPVKLHVIKPEFPLPLDPDLFFNKIDTSTLINTGYADAKRYLDAVPEDGIAFDRNATKMRNPGVTLNFRQHFSGNLKFDGKDTFVSYAPSFNFRRWDDDFALYVHSSIYIESLGREICTAKNKAVLKNDPEGRSISVSSEFVNNGDHYLLEAEIMLGTPLDWMTGLAFKTVKLRVSLIQNGGESILLNGRLTQNIRKRLKAILNTNIRNFQHAGWKLKEKWAMISKLLYLGRS